jgi:putative FmdB family regulatory protein
MPLYEYECDACAHRFERIQKFSDPLADTCPKCGGHVHKLLSSPAFQFKGSGFYITDYPKKSSGSESGRHDGAKSDGKSSDGKSSDGKSSDSSSSSSSDGGSASPAAARTESKPESKSDSKSDAKTESK